MCAADACEGRGREREAHHCLHGAARTHVEADPLRANLCRTASRMSGFRPVPTPRTVASPESTRQRPPTTVLSRVPRDYTPIPGTEY